MAGYRDHGNEHSDFMKGREILLKICSMEFTVVLIIIIISPTAKQNIEARVEVFPVKCGSLY